MSTSYLRVKSAFVDGTTKDTTIGPYSLQDLTTYRQQINTQVAILNNPTQREDTYEGFTSGFVSNAGANFASIRSCQIITTAEEVIY